MQDLVSRWVERQAEPANFRGAFIEYAKSNHQYVLFTLKHEEKLVAYPQFFETQWSFLDESQQPMDIFDT